MSTYLPQYVMTRDPRVLEAVAKNRAAIADWFARIKEFTDELGTTNTNVYINGALGETFVTGVPDVPAGHGQWTKGRSRRPYQSNTEWHEKMNALRVEFETLPGLPGIVRQEDTYRSQGWVRWNPSRAAFMFDGAVYADLKARSRSVMDGEELDLDVWTEIKASEFFAAKEDADQANGGDHE